MKNAFLLLSFLVLALSPVASPAAHADGDGDNMIEVETGVSFGDGDKGPAKLLIEIEYPGYQGKKNVTLFWVSGEFKVGINPQTGGMDFSKAEIQLVPATWNDVKLGDGDMGFRFLPVAFTRYIDIGIQSALKVSVIGFKAETEGPLSKQPSSEFLSRLSGFAEVAVDVIGFNTMHLVNGSNFTGGQVADVHFEAGLGYKINEAFTLKVSVQARAGASLGQVALGNIHGGAAGLQSEAIGKVELLVTKFKYHFSIFAEAEYDRLDLFSHQNPLHTGEMEFAIGIGGRF